MHQFLSAIGFENIQSNKEQRELLQQVVDSFTHQTIVSYDKNADFCEYHKTYGPIWG